MSAFAVPSRASDAGPEPKPEPPMDYDDLLHYASEELRDARVLRNDSVLAEIAMQEASLDKAEDYISQARQMLARRRALVVAGCGSRVAA